MTPEGKVKEKIKDTLKKHGVYYAMPIGTGFGNSGVPDFLCCIRGKFLAIEAKAGKGTTTALQEKHLAQINRAGGCALVIDESTVANLDEFLELMKGAE
jgi:pantoate kinase